VLRKFQFLAKAYLSVYCKFTVVTELLSTYVHSWYNCQMCVFAPYLCALGYNSLDSYYFNNCWKL